MRLHTFPVLLQMEVWMHNTLHILLGLTFGIFWSFVLLKMCETAVLVHVSFLHS